jgi:hypothetical protein
MLSNGHDQLMWVSLSSVFAGRGNPFEWQKIYLIMLISSDLFHDYMIFDKIFT